MTSISFVQDASQEMKFEDSLEKDLLQAALRFDQRTLGQIYDLYSPGLYRYAFRFLGDISVAEDCVADTFSRFLKAIRARRGPKDYLKAYLYRIAHNWIVDYYRRAPDVTELLETQPGNDDSPEQKADLRFVRAETRRAILQLTADQQRVIGLKFLEDWNNEEIAQAMDKPVGAVKALQHRALATLKRILEKEKIE
jgi:RNA polymerase sigma-70 factor (ECF subfamily)